eukprot:1182091-Amphidinium_carterae.1
MGPKVTARTTGAARVRGPSEAGNPLGERQLPKKPVSRTRTYPDAGIPAGIIHLVLCTSAVSSVFRSLYACGCNVMTDMCLSHQPSRRHFF